jgi:multiple sugar transport system permease protein
MASVSGRSWFARHNEAIEAYTFLLPTIVVVCTFIVFPVLFSVYLSLHDWPLLGTRRTFIGIDNYSTLLSDPNFWNALRVTVYFAAMVVPLRIVSSLLMALVLDRPVRARSIYRFVYFSPVLTSSVAVATVWAWIYEPQIGILNYALGLVGIEGPRWLSDTTTALPALALMAVWSGAGYDMVIFLAGLQGIPEEYYEAAKIDGAGRLGRFIHITWPLLAPTTFFVLVIGLIHALQVFDIAFIATQGGPLRSTETVILYLYRSGFEFSKMGYASAVGYALFVVIFVLTLIQWRALERRISY